MVKIKSPYLWLITPYIFFSGYSYLFAFWSTFKINFLEYSNFHDVILSSLYIVFPFIILFAIVSIIILVSAHILAHNTLLRDKFARFLNGPTRVWHPFFIFIFLLIPMVPAILRDSFWYMTLSVGAILSWYVICETDFLAKELHAEKRAIVLLCVIVLPFMMFLIGKIKAKKIHSATSYYYANINNEKLLHIGHINGKYFFIDENNTKIVVLREDNSTIQLTRFIRPVN